MKKNLICVLAVAWLAATPAWAALGGAPTYHGVRTAPEARAMAAGKSAAASYTVSTATLANGTVIREYVDAHGAVFGVAWSGPRMGSLEALLGNYFPAWQKGLASAQAARGGGYGPVAVREDDLVVESGGHMGALVGRAWLPRALPQGVSADQIH
ncbi:DUF2844 domain-containing protein [Paraburkholderia acidisoli]|jgi:hypothetical protein|uniref:DUF2844 domain-containing protein n=1 Tax=Paraburkholderia acidisoli TaxID=2571748 RepID=A0A7Z2GLJ7_9BURK|nr:DUF2844 domain-containing protein [Paraburkholderia acidisoli]QGZ63990.1 DUF2844 domain-containing protein [Paraburkholderia acidisoli]